jgi:hypothetical protein
MSKALPQPLSTDDKCLCCEPKRGAIWGIYKLNIPFDKADRILYEADKKINDSEKIKY